MLNTERDFMFKPLFLAVASILLVVPNASAGTMLLPAAGQDTYSSSPVFTWQDGDGDAFCYGLNFARSTAVNAAGRMYTGSREEFSDENTWQATYESERLYAGTWYWQIECTTNGSFTDYWSAPRRLDVLGKVVTVRARVASWDYLREVSLTPSWWSNTRAARISVVIRQGTTVVGSRSWSAYNLSIAQRNSSYATAKISSSVRNGATLTATYEVRGVGGGRAVLRQSFVY